MFTTKFVKFKRTTTITSVSLPSINYPIVVLIKVSNMLLKNTHSMILMAYCFSQMISGTQQQVLLLDLIYK